MPNTDLSLSTTTLTFTASELEYGVPGPSRSQRVEDGDAANRHVRGW